MVKHPTNDWLAEGTHPSVDIALQYIGATWPLEKRESIFKPILRAIFPPNYWANTWGGYDQTLCTIRAPFYYPVTVPLGAPLDVWFKNLHLFQIRMKLCLITSLWLSMLDPLSCIVGQIVAKIEALKGALGKHIVEEHRLPKFKRPKMSVKHNQTNVAKESSRNRGLVSQDRRIGM